MKKTLMATLLVLASIQLQANDAFINDKMKLMRDGMVTMQDGFFYNQPQAITNGIGMVRESLKIDKAKLLPKNKSNMIGMVERTTSSIENSLKNMEEFVNAKDYANASDEYANIVNRCSICHKIARGW